MDNVRREFPVAGNLVYFNHAAVAPLPLRSVKRVEDFLREYAAKGCLDYPEWMVYQERVRGLAARLVGGDESEIAFVKNTSTGISIIAQGLVWRTGDNIIIPETEFPANAYPWFNLWDKGVEVRMVRERGGRYRVEDFESLVDGRTRLISVSWVEFATGFRNDLAAIGDLCRERGIHFCVDAIQGLGVLWMDVEEYKIDFLAADGHKWLLAPEGIGILYVSRRVAGELRPLFVGWNSVEDPSDYLPYHFDRLRKDARKFEEGSPNLLGTFALGSSLELLLEVGIEKVEERVIALTDLLVDGLVERGCSVLSPRGEGEKSGIVVFSSCVDDNSVFNRLMEDGVFCALRGGGIRLSPHLYNTEEEVYRFFDILDRLVP